MIRVILRAGRFLYTSAISIAFIFKAMRRIIRMTGRYFYAVSDSVTYIFETMIGIIWRTGGNLYAGARCLAFIPVTLERIINGAFINQRASASGAAASVVMTGIGIGRARRHSYAIACFIAGIFYTVIRIVRTVRNRHANSVLTGYINTGIRAGGTGTWLREQP